MKSPDYSQYEAITVKNDGGIATVTLNRPDQLNAINPQLHTELEYIWVDIARDPDIKVVVLTGAGRAFSAGGDLKRMAERAGTEDNLKHTLRVPANAGRIYNTLMEVSQPIIAAVNGDAIGLGANIALFCDMSIIAEGAKFGDTHVRVGLAAGDGGAVIWPMLVGPQRAKEFLMRGALLKGEEAARIGLVNHAVPAEEVLKKAYAFAAELAALPVWAVRFTKLSVNKALKDQLNLILDASIAFEAITMHTHDFGESARAFVEKRKPVYKGF